MKVPVKITGGALQEVEAKTVGEVKNALGVGKYTANVNGSPASDSKVLGENDFVTLAPPVKGN